MLKTGGDIPFWRMSNLHSVEGVAIECFISSLHDLHTKHYSALSSYDVCLFTSEYFNFCQMHTILSSKIYIYILNQSLMDSRYSSAECFSLQLVFIDFQWWKKGALFPFCFSILLPLLPLFTYWLFPPYPPLGNLFIG